MNWHQLYTIATPLEREEITTDLLNRIYRQSRWLQFCKHFYLVPPIGFSLRAAILMMTLLAFMPHHPMAIPTAIGGGISFALLLQR